MANHYPDPKFRTQAAEYYDVAAAERFLDAPVAKGLERWRCRLCGWPIDMTPAAAKIAPACCCGGCGMTCLRPIEEF